MITRDGRELSANTPCFIHTKTEAAVGSPNQHRKKGSIFLTQTVSPERARLCELLLRHPMHRRARGNNVPPRNAIVNIGHDQIEITCLHTWVLDLNEGKSRLMLERQSDGAAGAAHAYQQPGMLWQHNWRSGTQGKRTKTCGDFAPQSLDAYGMEMPFQPGPLDKTARLGTHSGKIFSNNGYTHNSVIPSQAEFWQEAFMTDAPAPLPSPFDPLITAGLKQLGIEKSNDVQNRVWPELLSKKDVLLIAQTGSGKTAAYAAPAFQHLLNSRDTRQPDAPRVLILAPTRELVTQIAGVCRQIGRRLPFRTRLLCGGLPKDAQIEALAEGVDIAVATPGRLIDLLMSGACRLDLTSMLVVDEVDQMLDEDFLAAMDEIMPHLPRERQAMLCSATLPPAGRELAKRLLHKPVELEFASQTVTPRRIKQRAMFVETEEKLATLTRLCSETDGRQIVFVRTRASADTIGKHLRKAGLPVAVLHGDLAQGARQKSVEFLRGRRQAILVTTDVAARGLDIDDVALVLNYDLPEKAETYVHRIGRTARAGKRGAALSFCTRDERLMLRAIEKEIGYRISIVS